MGERGEEEGVVMSGFDGRLSAEILMWLGGEEIGRSRRVRDVDLTGLSAKISNHYQGRDGTNFIPPKESSACHQGKSLPSRHSTV